MSALPAGQAAIQAVVNSQGELVSADPLLMNLHLRAGGEEGGPLAIPQLAALARLALRLNTLISRPVIAADRDADIDMWVRARPDHGMVTLTIADWKERDAEPPSPVIEQERQADLVRASEGWNWRIDGELRFLAMPRTAPATNGENWPEAGTLLTHFFRLEEGEDHQFPILKAMAERVPFLDQHAAVRERPQERYVLSGFPIFDAHGSLVGYRGKAAAAGIPAAQGTPTPEQGAYAHMFGQRLDRALRKPLGRIIANAETISGQLQGPLRRDYAAYASDIAAAGRHLMELVDDLADLQAIERPDFNPVMEDIDLADIARRTAGLLGVKASDRKIRIEAPGPEESLPATGEFRRSLQILVNLVGNAIRYAPEASLVQIQCEQGEEWAKVIVADEGGGIDPEDREKIFDKFERLGRDDAGGSGLGLYISRRLARAMQGDLTVEGTTGKGARFILRLKAR
ncbi:HAMP domain-containing sensor histidine kinase [Rhizorhapis sp.]|uniref:sensor histidine kinase n=1 Tax=Rhizorhapis sp. TaxID=1968842 RepID=UPI002B46268D|nr:HAMP domain-containing sensor histidine kinase [Rhizorhapis sp.]HKR17617.1 HAMP domain-containing sensor histidine kinase [Rhizorhapis sp.]